VFDPDAAFTVDPSRLHHRHPLTPYAGRELRGKVEATYVRGELRFGN
jgi:allantoinase